ncbi:MAG: galactose-1-phosphate uridylyltransferase [Syntrophobacterales bacterium]|nr:MAG: galactose-1-phosphate uridylyltransferase [Syntrophobacterales bacterium]
MPELRKDPIIGRWVIISTERGRRPSEFFSDEIEVKDGFCPLCEGNEDKTPPEVFAIRENGSPPDSPGWTLRVVSNKFPALRVEGNLNRQGEGLYDKMNGVGAHEVVIETPEHDETLTTLPIHKVMKVLTAYRERISDLNRDPRVRYVLVFKNQGAAAGASLEHSHSQIIALPVVPKRVSEEIDGAKAYYKYKDRCVFCDIIRQEIGHKARIIEENTAAIALAPFASRFPFETWILPKDHSAYFHHTEAAQFEDMASLLSDALRRIDSTLPSSPYNFMLHTAPSNKNAEEFYHWHIEIIPKLTKVAGFEWGTGFYINPTPPEEAAKYLREARPQGNRG